MIVQSNVLELFISPPCRVKRYHEIRPIKCRILVFGEPLVTVSELIIMKIGMRNYNTKNTDREMLEKNGYDTGSKSIQI